MSSLFHPPRHIVWSTDTLDMSDLFQRRWYPAQVLMHGTAEDIRGVDKDEVALELDFLNLPRDIERLWRFVLDVRHE